MESADTYVEKKDFRTDTPGKKSTICINLTSLQLSRLEVADKKWPGSKDRVFYAGYVSPEQFVDYKCTKCDKLFDGAPAEHIVYIDFEKNKTTEKVGMFFYICECKNYIIGTEGMVYEDDVPDIKFIDQDLSGKFIPITEDFVEGFLTMGKKEASNCKIPFGNLNKAKRLGEKINYSVYKKIKSIEEIYKNALEENYIENLEKNLEDFKEEMSMMHVDSEYGLYPFGIEERIKDFFKYVPKIEKPKNSDMSKKIEYICSTLNNFYRSLIESAEEDIMESEEGLLEARKGIRVLLSKINETTAIEKKFKDINK